MKVRCPKIIKKTLYPFRKMNSFIWEKVKKNIRLELILIFAVCLLSSFIIAAFCDSSLRGRHQHPRIDYSMSMKRMSDESMMVSNAISHGNLSINDKNGIESILQQQHDKNFKVLICGLDGKVLYKSQNANETEIDLHDTIKSSIDIMSEMKYKSNRNENAKEYFNFYPVTFSDGKGYVIVKGVPSAEIVYDENSNTEFPSFALAFASFLGLFYFLTSKKMKYIEVVSSGLLEISKGNLDYRIERQGDDELASLADNINFMAQELKNKIENERKAEKTKNELITNVSHDLRTPLTSIKGYLCLAKDKKYTDEQQLNQYLDIASNKAEKLEALINDLFEYTKLTSNDVKVNKQIIALNGLLEQLMEELVPICEDNNVTMSKDFLKERITVMVDPNKTARVFENLMVNAIRYSTKPGDIKIILAREEDFALVSIQNKCDEISEEDLAKMFDRFYRVDKSRSSDTGGSGLGLAIAKNIVELQGGTIDAKYENGHVSFNVRFQLWKD